MAFWADRTVDRIEKELRERIAAGGELVVRDEKTASGHPHIGSMIGVAIHGTITRVLQERGINAKYYYEINDTDPMDGMPVYLDAAVYDEHMGKPLNRVPAPDPAYPNLAEYFAADFISVITETGYTPHFYRTSELYTSGRMNEVIRTALTNGEQIRAIYQKVSGSQKPEGWLPINVICEQCGKVGATLASDFDGETVAYTCRPRAAEWADGCGHSGRISPFDGNATFPWKVEWPAKFKVMDVAVEGAGKDHTTRGGARDVADHIAREVFNFTPPFNIPYEYFLVGGKKMSSSKGNASTAREIADLLPPHIYKLALIGREINRQANFDPQGDSIPLLFDKYDRCAKAYWSDVHDDNARTFVLIHEAGSELLEQRFLPRFSQVAFLVQMPHLDIHEEVARMKGDALTPADHAELDLRVRYARHWLEAHAPEQFRFVIQESVPERAAAFTDTQKEALADILAFVREHESLTGEMFHHRLHEIKTERDISPKELFSALYILFLDRESGPQAGWFLSTLDRDFLITQLSKAVS